VPLRKRIGYCSKGNNVCLLLSTILHTHLRATHKTIRKFVKLNLVVRVVSLGKSVSMNSDTDFFFCFADRASEYIYLSN